MVITAEAADPTDVGIAHMTAQPIARRRSLACLVAALLAAVVPILVAGIRAVLRGWTPTGDESYSAIRAWDLFSNNPPLLGTWSSASQYTDHHINHPGPLQFDLLALPVRLLGHGPGTAVGLSLVNAAAVALLGWLVYRRLGLAAATLAYGACALLIWSMGSEMLYSVWSQHAPLLPFALFLVAVWCTVAGDWLALPVTVVAGNYALQTHLSYAILVPGLLLFAITAVAWRVVRRRRNDPGGWPELRRRTLRWTAITVAAQLVVGIQPLVEQITAPGEGNVAALWRSSSAEVPTPSLGATVRVLGGTVVLPPAWLPSSFGSPSFDLLGNGASTSVAGAGLLGLALVLGVLGWRALRRGSTGMAAGALTGLVTLALALVTIPRAPIRWGIVPTYLRWMWPLGMVLWLVLAVAVLDELRARAETRAAAQSEARSGNSESTAVDADPGSDGTTSATAGTASGVGPAARWALPGLVVALVAGCATLPRIDHGSASPDWTVDALHAVDDEVRAAVAGRNSVLVQFSAHIVTGGLGPPILVLLQDAGVRFYVDEPALVRQLGEVRRFDLGDATTTLRVDGGRFARAQPGERLVASWADLDDRQRAELERLDRQVEDLVHEHGLVLTPDAGRFLRKAGDVSSLGRLEGFRDEPEQAVDSGLVRHLWAGGGAALRGEPLLDTDVYPRELMDRWVDLWIRNDERSLEVYVGTVQTFE
jgi:hypothetical protein